MTERFHPHPLLLDISPDLEKKLTPAQVYEIYSKLQVVSLQDLYRAHPTGTYVAESNSFVVDTPDTAPRRNKKITYALHQQENGTVQGLKKEIRFYSPILSDKKPHVLDTLRIKEYEYDDEGYLVREVDMEMGKPGHVYFFEYVSLDNDQKVLSAITSQAVLRQGYMEPGPITGIPDRMNFSEFHPISTIKPEENVISHDVFDVTSGIESPQQP